MLKPLALIAKLAVNFSRIYSQIKLTPLNRENAKPHLARFKARATQECPEESHKSHSGMLVIQKCSTTMYLQTINIKFTKSTLVIAMTVSSR